MQQASLEVRERIMFASKKHAVSFGSVFYFFSSGWSKHLKKQNSCLCFFWLKMPLNWLKEFSLNYCHFASKLELLQCLVFMFSFAFPCSLIMLSVLPFVYNSHVGYGHLHLASKANTWKVLFRSKVVFSSFPIISKTMYAGYYFFSWGNQVSFPRT